MNITDWLKGKEVQYVAVEYVETRNITTLFRIFTPVISCHHRLVAY